MHLFLYCSGRGYFFIRFPVQNPLIVFNPGLYYNTEQNDRGAEYSVQPQLFAQNQEREAPVITGLKHFNVAIVRAEMLFSAIFWSI